MKIRNLEDDDLKIKYEYNGKLVHVVQKILGTIMLSLLWLACCIPVFTIGASSRALFHTAYWVLRNELSYPGREFFKEFRKQFGKSVAVWVPFWIAAVALAAGGIYLYLTLDTKIASIAAALILGIILELILVWMAYLVAYISIFDLDDKRTSFKNSYAMMCTHPLKSLLVFGLFVLVTIIVSWMPITVIALPALVAFLHTVLFENIFKEYADPKDWAAMEEKFRQEL